MKEASKNAVVVVAAGAPAGGAPKAAKEEEKPKEEEADVDMGGLFGDDYWVSQWYFGCERMPSLFPSFRNKLNQVVSYIYLI